MAAMTCRFVSRGKLAETEAVMLVFPVVRIARSPMMAILPDAN
jgi:hypothetical protein